MGTNSELLKKQKNKSFILKNAVILGSQKKENPECLNCLSQSLSESLQVSELPFWITKRRKKNKPKVIIWPRRSFWDQNQIFQFSVKKMSELLWLHLFSELLGYRPSTHYCEIKIDQQGGIAFWHAKRPSIFLTTPAAFSTVTLSPRLERVVSKI